MTPFRRRVLDAVNGLPAGAVVTYGEIAMEVGHPGAARAVGSALRDVGDGLPWWRVVPASGELVERLAERQAALLRAEGVTVVAGRVRRTTSTGAATAAYRGGPATKD